MLGKLHLICMNFPDISYLSETQKNNFQFLTCSEVQKSFEVSWAELYYPHLLILSNGYFQKQVFFLTPSCL